MKLEISKDYIKERDFKSAILALMLPAATVSAHYYGLTWLVYIFAGVLILQFLVYSAAAVLVKNQSFQEKLISDEKSAKITFYHMHSSVLTSLIITGLSLGVYAYVSLPLFFALTWISTGAYLAFKSGIVTAFREV